MLFDQYSRYLAVSSCIEFAKRHDLTSSKTVLDIGSGPYCLLGNFLSNTNIRYLDPLLSTAEVDIPNTNLFHDDIFSPDLPIEALRSDVVVTIDTFEHIPAEKRDTFLKTCSTLTNEIMVFAFPCSDTSTATEIDLCVNSFYQAITGEEYPWLYEHRSYGLPSTKKTREFLTDLGWSSIQFKHGNAEWLKQILPPFIALNDIDIASNLLEEISEIFNKEFAPYDLGFDGYRSIVLAWKTGRFDELDLENKLSEINCGKVSVELEERASKLTSDLYSKSLPILCRKIRELRAELGNSNKTNLTMGEWGKELQDGISKRDEIIEVYQSELKDLQNSSFDLAEWAKELKGEVSTRDEIIEAYQKEIKSRDSTIISLQEQIASLQKP